MRVDIVTIFPEAFAPLDLSILGRARERGLLEIVVWDLREFTTDRHRQVDDSPYGGGAGMVMKPEPFFAAVDAIRAAAPATSPRIILTSPQGERLTHALARRLAGEVSRHEGARGAAVRRPRDHPAVAARAAVAPHPGAAPRPAARGRAQR